jgi:tRNA pseudouridine38-40 synthase
VKIAFGVEYDGSRFHGWQRQRKHRSVQSCVEQALSRVANVATTVICAGRTDTGVHATGQVIHTESGAERSQRSWILGANSNLPSDVSVKWARVVDDEFHARFSATARTYRYIICNRVSRPAVWANKVSFVFRPLDVNPMAEAANFLIGRHDFSSFRAAGCQSRHAVRQVRRIAICRHQDFIAIEIEANAFLQHMVRNIVGTLLAVGDGREPPAFMADVLAAQDRTAAGQTAPPDGLYLVGVDYPDRFGLSDCTTSQNVGFPLL